MREFFFKKWEEKFKNERNTEKWEKTLICEKKLTKWEENWFKSMEKEWEREWERMEKLSNTWNFPQKPNRESHPILIIQFHTHAPKRYN